MKYTVFLDTTIYDQANYNFHNAVFSRLKEYAAEERISLQINSVVEGEVRENIENHVSAALKDVNRAMEHPALNAVRSFPGLEKQFAKVPVQELTEKAQQSFQDFLTAMHTERISANGIDVEDIIVSCFRKEPPFDTDTQDAFKEAVSVASLLRQVRNHKTDSYCIISKDPAFLNSVRLGLGLHERVDENILLFDDIRGLTDLMEAGSYMAVSKNKSVNGAVKATVRDAIAAMDFRPEDVDPFTIRKKITDIDEITFEPHIIQYDRNSKKAVLSLEVKAEISVEYAYIDEDESIFDKSTGTYVWRDVTELGELYSIAFDMVVEVDLSEGKTKKSGAAVILEAPSYLDLLDDDCLDSDIFDDDDDDDEDDEDDEEEGGK